MEIKNYSAYNEKEILKVYSSVGWTAYTDEMCIRDRYQKDDLVYTAVLAE